MEARLSHEPLAADYIGLAERLERGELIYFPSCPFSLPSSDDRAFLSRQEVAGRLHKNISFNPPTGTVTGYRRQTPEQAEGLAGVLAGFAVRAQRWLARVLPGYAAAWQPDRVSFRPEEEALRKTRLTARDDLLHLDAFPSRPTQGRRILRLYVNLNDQEPRVWVTSDTFRRLLSRFGQAAGLPAANEDGWSRLRRGLAGFFQPSVRRRSIYDRFMLRFHDFLKCHHEFQERGPKRFWTFAPGSAWLLFSDSLSHADLRGRFLLDHSFFVAAESLALPEESPAHLLQHACGLPVLARAA
jgi:hypothetical protein